MTMLMRWGRFNLVGAMGMAVQLAAFMLLRQTMPRHTLLASGAAVEFTLMHNFVWHLRFTWRDHLDRLARCHVCVRFHLSNGLISMVGNVGLMALFVRWTRLPALVANLMAILCCSVANFWMGNSWVFSKSDERTYS